MLQESKAQPSSEDDYAKWVKEFGKDGADIVEKTMQANLEDYEYLKQFALKFPWGSLTMEYTGTSGMGYQRSIQPL